MGSNAVEDALSYQDEDSFNGGLGVANEDEGQLEANDQSDMEQDNPQYVFCAIQQSLGLLTRRTQQPRHGPQPLRKGQHPSV
jgi:hypothetical protein